VDCTPKKCYNIYITTHESPINYFPIKNMGKENKDEQTWPKAMFSESILVGLLQN
jgi:hypothetical protein